MSSATRPLATAIQDPLAGLRDGVARAADACSRLQSAHDKLLADHVALQASHDKLVQYIASLASGFNDHTRAIQILRSQLPSSGSDTDLPSEISDMQVAPSSSIIVPPLQPHSKSSSTPVPNQSQNDKSNLKQHTKPSPVPPPPQQQPQQQQQPSRKDSYQSANERPKATTPSTMKHGNPLIKTPQPPAPQPEHLPSERKQSKMPPLPEPQQKQMQHSSQQPQQPRLPAKPTPPLPSQAAPAVSAFTAAERIVAPTKSISSTPTPSDPSKTPARTQSQPATPAGWNSVASLKTAPTPIPSRKRRSISPEIDDTRANGRSSRSSTSVRRNKHIRPEPLPMKRLEQLTITLGVPVSLSSTIGSLSQNDRDDLTAYIRTLANAPKDQFLLRYTGFPEPINSTYHSISRFVKPYGKDARPLAASDKQKLREEIKVMKELSPVGYVRERALEALSVWFKSEKTQDMNVLDFIQYHCTLIFRLSNFEIPKDPDHLIADTPDPNGSSTTS